MKSIIMSLANKYQERYYKWIDIAVRVEKIFHSSVDYEKTGNMSLIRMNILQCLFLDLLVYDYFSKDVLKTLKDNAEDHILKLGAFPFCGYF